MSIQGFNEGFVQLVEEGTAPWAIPVIFVGVVLHGLLTFGSKVGNNDDSSDSGCCGTLFLLLNTLFSSVVDIGTIVANIKGSAAQKTFAAGTIMHMVGYPMAVGLGRDGEFNVSAQFSVIYFVGELCEIIALLMSVEDNLAFGLSLALVIVIGGFFLCGLCGMAGDRESFKNDDAEIPANVAIGISSLLLLIPVIALAATEGAEYLVLFLPEFPLEIIDMIILSNM